MQSVLCLHLVMFPMSGGSLLSPQSASGINQRLQAGVTAGKKRECGLDDTPYSSLSKRRPRPTLCLPKREERKGLELGRVNSRFTVRYQILIPEE